MAHAATVKPAFREIIASPLLVVRTRGLEMRPEHRDPIPEVTIGRGGSGLGHGVSADLQVGVVFGLSQPVWIATAVGIAGFGEARPIADHASLNDQVVIYWTIAALPRE